MLICSYSTIEMYREYKNGMPISEIISKTGISRKTWNKRFERVEKKLNMATNPSGEDLINSDNQNVTVQNGDISTDANKVVRNNGDISYAVFWIILGIIALIILVKGIYDWSKHEKIN